jgi:hypothetical protein
MSLELINNLLELSEKHMNEGDYNQVAMLLKEKYKIIDDVDYETMLIVPPIEIYSELNLLFSVKAFKYKKSVKNLLCEGESKCLHGDFLLQVGEQEHCIKHHHLFNFIDTIIENDLLSDLCIKNSFYGKVRKFSIHNLVSLYQDISNDDEEERILFNSYVKTQCSNICHGTIKQTIMRLFRTM